MKKRLLAPLLMGVVLLFCLSGCQVAPAAPTAVPSATPDHRAFVRAAEQMYLAGDFAGAYAKAQAAVQAAPQDATSWEWVRRAAVAKAADDYLQRLPEDRFRITPAEYQANVVNGQLYAIIDVRQPDEYAAGHMEGAINIPMRELTRRLSNLPVNTSTPILVYCHSGRRSTHVLVLLQELGYNRAYELDDGYAAFEEHTAAHPLPTPGPTPTLDPARDPAHDGGC